MELHDYLNKLMRDFKIKNLALSAATELSPSYICKIRSGQRKPPVGSETFETIYRALLSLADDESHSGLHDHLPASYEEFIKLFLHQDASTSVPRRMNQLMEAFDVSNHTLAKYVNCDASLISKFRSGERLPKHEKYMLHVAAFFAEKSMAYNTNEFADILAAAPELKVPFPLTRTALEQSFLRYLCNDGQDYQFFDKMFTIMNGATPVRPDLSKLSTILQGATLPAKETIRRKGYDGLRKLVLNFLALCANSPVPLELKLFSNHDMRWMIEDSTFFGIWKLLMMAVLSKGHKIQIVHNLLRSDGEMYAAIEGWLPLHLYGNLDSAAFQLPPDPTFSNTLFICRDNFCVTGHSIRGLENETDFYFIRNPQALKQIEQGYDALAAHASPLLQTENFHQDLPAMDALLHLYDTANHGSFYSLQKNLPIWSIDPNLLSAILDRNQISPERKQRILTYVQNIKKRCLARIKTADIYECFYVPTHLSPEDLTLDIIDAEAEGVIRYQPDDYLRHLCSIRDIVKKYPRYHVILLEEPTFANLKILKNEYGGFHAVNLLPPLSLIRYNNDISRKIHRYIEQKLLPRMRSQNELDQVLERLHTLPTP